MTRHKIQGPRPGDLVSWSAELEDGMEFRTTMGGSSIPLAMRPPTITLQLEDLTSEEAYRAIGAINNMRVAMSQAKPSVDRMTGEPERTEPLPRVLNRFEGLDI